MARATESSRITLSSSVYDVLYRDIVSATLMPGVRLQTRALCGRFGVGLSPIREALNRLSSENLVVRQDRRGFVVAPVSEQDLAELTKTRCWLNEIGIRQSIAQGDSKWEESVVIAFHRLSRTPRFIPEFDRGRNPAWEMVHTKFHHSLISACGSHWLIDFCGRMFDAAERYRHIARITGAARQPNHEEHRAIMDAVVRRDADEAVRLNNLHFQTTSDYVMTTLRANAEKEAAQPRQTRRKAELKSETTGS